MFVDLALHIVKNAILLVEIIVMNAMKVIINLMPNVYLAMIQKNVQHAHLINY